MPFIAELKRRNVFRVGVAYVIVAWILIEVASVVLPTFEAPDWVMKAFSFLLILGFPVALIFAWAFELTPEGIKRESDVDSDESTTRTKGRKLDFAIIGLLVIAVVFLVIDNYVLEAEPEQVEVATEQIPAAESTPREKSIAVLLFDNALDELEIHEVHIPRIGCGLGGLDWDLEVEPMLLEVEETLARTHPVTFVVCDV
jgi:hypothetical protein